MTVGIKRSVAALALAVAAVMPVQAGGSLDLSLANDDFRIAYDATQVNSGVHFNVSWLHHEDDGNMFTGGLHVVDVRPSARNLYVGIGAKLHVVDTDYFDAAAIGVGGFFRYAFPSHRDLAVAGYVYYAPSVLSFSDAENLFNSDIRLQYSIIPSARVFVGYRHVSIGVEGYNKRYELGDGLHGGLSIDF